MGLVLSALATPLYGLVSVIGSPYVVLGILPVSGLASLVQPAVAAIKSNNVAADEQGNIQGALYGVRALGIAVGPLLFGAVFSAFTSKSNGMPYIPAMPFYLGA